MAEGATTAVAGADPGQAEALERRQPSPASLMGRARRGRRPRPPIVGVARRQGVAHRNPYFGYGHPYVVLFTLCSGLASENRMDESGKSLGDLNEEGAEPAGAEEDRPAADIPVRTVDLVAGLAAGLRLLGRVP